MCWLAFDCRIRFELGDRLPFGSKLSENDGIPPCVFITHKVLIERWTAISHIKISKREKTNFSPRRVWLDFCANKNNVGNDAEYAITYKYFVYIERYFLRVTDSLSLSLSMLWPHDTPIYVICTDTVSRLLFSVSHLNTFN